MAKRKVPSEDDRRSNIYGHEAMDLKTREEMVRRGVKKNTPNMPSMDATYKPGDKVSKRVREGKVYRKGGSVSARADGLAKRGKTKGKFV